MSNCIFNFLLCREGFSSRPRICGESDAESLQISIVCGAGFLFWRDKRRGKLCVCNDAIQREKSSSQANTPEYDRSSDWMDSLSQRDQAGHASDYQREQTHRYQHGDNHDYFLRAGILSYGCVFHDCCKYSACWAARFNRNVREQEIWIVFSGRLTRRVQI